MNNSTCYRNMGTSTKWRRKACGSRSGTRVNHSAPPAAPPSKQVCIGFPELTLRYPDVCSMGSAHPCTQRSACNWFSDGLCLKGFSFLYSHCTMLPLSSPVAHLTLKCSAIMGTVPYAGWACACTLCIREQCDRHTLWVMTLRIGRLCVRTGMIPEGEQESRVLSPTSTGGLQRSELTIANILKSKGYTTGNVCWHYFQRPNCSV